MRFRPTYYEGQEVVTTGIDFLANLIFGGVLIEHVAFLFMMAIFITIAQLLFDTKSNKYVHRAGLITLLFLNYPLFIYFYWMISLEVSTNVANIFYWTHIIDLIAIAFYFGFIWSSFFFSIGWMRRYFWLFIVPTVALIVEMFLYMTIYNETILVFGFVIVLIGSIFMWAILYRSSLKHKKSSK